MPAIGEQARLELLSGITTEAAARTSSGQTLKNVADRSADAKYRRAGQAEQVPATLYHGTSSTAFEQFGPGMVYFTTDPSEAGAYASNDILGGGRGTGQRRVLRVTAKPGAVQDIQAEMDASIMEEEGTKALDETINDLAVQARGAGKRWLAFTHPGAG